MATLKELREKAFLSVPELAEKSGIPRNTIYGIESGRHKPIKRTIRALAKALELKPEDINI
jgi:DNA-binding XRE family transcriptional regulator